MKMRRRLFYILYAIIVLVLFSASVALTHFKIPAVGSILALFIGYAISTGRIRTVVEFILNIFENNYYLD